MYVSLRQIGNSRGIVIPKPVLAQLDLASSDGVEMIVESDALVVRKPVNSPRSGWAEAARAIAASKDDELLLGDFANEDDRDLTW